MHWFSRRKSKEVTVAWQYTTKGNLWRLFPSASGHIVLEDRNVERKEVSFACLDHQTGKVFWADVQFQERWWISIDSICSGVLFLHEYASPDMPDHKKIYAVDLSSGVLIWSNQAMK